MSMFIPETLGTTQLLELGEARRRSTVHFHAVSERLSNVGKEAKRRMSAVSLGAKKTVNGYRN